MKSRIAFPIHLIFSIIALIIFSFVKADNPAPSPDENPLQKSAEECTLLKDPEGWSIDLWKPGNYCLGMDLKQFWPADRAPHQRLPISPMINIYSSEVSLDLKEHSLLSETPMHFGVYKSFSDDAKKLPTIIKNGKITTIAKPAIFIVEMWNLENKRFGRPYSFASSRGDISKYKPTLIILENLTIKSNQYAIIMQGKRNIIRNCIIIGGNGTVNVYGPNLLFEGNTIVSDMKEPHAAGNEPPVALYIEDAADSIIRNNKFIIRGSSLLNSTAIALANSPNILIERNTVSGTSEFYKLQDDRSSVRAIGNYSK